MSKLTIETYKELLTVQKTFDDRITTKNIDDTSIAYVVEFFEWVNTVEVFKNWKATPGKPRETQLDELADMLAFGLSLLNQALENEEGEFDLDGFLETTIHHLAEFGTFELTSKNTLDYATHLLDAFTGNDGVISGEAISFLIAQPFLFANTYYTTDELVDAYKTKMRRNHDRQDGTADEDKGYV